MYCNELRKEFEKEKQYPSWNCNDTVKLEYIEWLEQKIKLIIASNRRVCVNCGWLDFPCWSNGVPICTCGMFPINDIETFSCNVFMTKEEYDKKFDD